MNKLIVITTVILFSVSNLYAQQDFKKQLKKGDKLITKGFYGHALPIYEDILAKDPEHTLATYNFGVCMLNLYKKKLALELIAKAYEKDPNVNEHVHYWLGMAYHSNLMFNKSIDHFTQYQATLKPKDSRYQDCIRYNEQNRSALNLTNKAPDYYLVNLGDVINTHHAEHSPAISSDGNTLIYTSRREESTGHKEAPDGDFFEDIYMTKWMDTAWSAPTSIGSQMNTTGHDASIQLYENDTKLLFYRYTKQGDFYSATLVDGKWQNVERVKSLNTRSFESDGHITSDGKKIIFCSARDSRDGNLDLFIAEMGEEGEWLEAIPITEINTSADEDSPYLTPDGKTLYFSCRGRNSMGGYDIFRSNYIKGGWSKPVNMGYPVNSPDDDIYYVETSDGKKAYISSFRLDGYGDKDIYEVKKIPFVIVKGDVFDTTGVNKGKAIKDIQITFYSMEDSALAAVDTTKDLETPPHLTALQNRQEINLRLVSNKKLYDEYNTQIDSLKLIGEQTDTSAYVAKKQALEKGYEDLANKNEDLEKQIKDDESFLKDMDDPELQKELDANKKTFAENKVKMDSLEKEFSSLTPEVVVSDSVDAELNALMVKQQNISTQIKKDSITLNTPIDSTAMTVVDQKTVKAPTEGYNVKLKAGRTYLVDVLKNNDTIYSGEYELAVQKDENLEQTKNFYVAYTDSSELKPQPVVPKVYASKGKDDIENIFYRFDNHEITEIAKLELDSIAQIMLAYNDPALQLKLTGHTDSKGPAAYNMYLSKKRALAAKGYLISKGIDPERLQIDYKGEADPIAPNENADGTDNPEGRAANRRTELQFVDMTGKSGY